MMKRAWDRLRLADRVESILRTDRHALRHVREQSQEPLLLLALASESGIVQDFLDGYLPEIAEAAGLGYVRLIASGLTEVPRHYVESAFLVVADVTGRAEEVITLVYQCLGSGRRILLAAQHPDEVPPDLAEIPLACFNLDQGDFRGFLEEVAAYARPGARPAERTPAPAP